jgi:hypothetical protein
VAYLSSIEEKQRYQAILEVFLRVFSPAAREGGVQNPRQSHQQVRNRVATSSNVVSRETVANSRRTGKKSKPIRLPENRDEETILLESVKNRLKEDSIRDDGVPQPLLGRRFILWNADPALEAERYVSSSQEERRREGRANSVTRGNNRQLQTNFVDWLTINFLGDGIASHELQAKPKSGYLLNNRHILLEFERTEDAETCFANAIRYVVEITSRSQPRHAPFLPVVDVRERAMRDTRNILARRTLRRIKDFGSYINEHDRPARRLHEVCHLEDEESSHPLDADQANLVIRTYHLLWASNGLHGPTFMDRLLRYLPHPRNEGRFELSHANVTPLPAVAVVSEEQGQAEEPLVAATVPPVASDAEEGKNEGPQAAGASAHGPDTQGGRKKRRPIPPRSPARSGGSTTSVGPDVTDGAAQASNRSSSIPSLALLRSPKQKRRERQRDHYSLPGDPTEEEDEKGDATGEGERKDEDTNPPVDQGGGDRGNGDRGRDSVMQ